MQKLISFSFLFGSLVAQGAQLTGVVTDNDKNGAVEFRTATEDIFIQRSDLSAEQLSQMDKPEARKKIHSVEVADSAIVQRDAVPLGIRPDCTELPMSKHDLEEIIASPEVNNIEDFLRKIPEGTFQGFTYVTKSHSAQKGEGESEVREEWPRVLRTNAEGTISFSWTCDPKSKTYGHVEMLYFDKETNKLSGSSYKLNKQAGTTGPGGRIDPNPKSCVTCHATGVPINGKLSMKHNWPEYFFWGDCQARRGITLYGMSDDNMGSGPASFRERGRVSSVANYRGCTDQQDLQTHNKMRQSFQDFKKQHFTPGSENPCYSLLPHPKGEDPSRKGLSYKNYPYAEEAQAFDQDGYQDYALRTNARLTDIYGHLLSRRNAQIIKESAFYEKAKYFIALEAANCINNEDMKDVKKVLPELGDIERPGDLTNDEIGSDPRKTTILYGVSKLAGMRPADWSMQFDSNTDYQDPQYHAVMFRENLRGREIGDFGVKDVTGGIILKDIGDGDPLVKAASAGVFARGSTDNFGPRFGCIDDLGQGIRTRAKENNGQICTALRAQNRAHLKKLNEVMCAAGPQSVSATSSQIADTNKNLDKVRDQLRAQDASELAESIERGRELVQGGKANCIKCHGRTEKNKASSPAGFLFVPADHLPAEERQQSLAALKRRANSGFMESIDEMISTGQMPMDTTINDQESKDVMNYMRNLITAD